MTPPVRPEQSDFEKWKAERDFREWQAARRRVPQPDEIAARNAADQAAVTEGGVGGKMAQAAADAASFGVVGLLEDALTKGNFRENRDLRRANQDALRALPSVPTILPNGTVLPVDLSTVANVAGGLANPARFLKPVVQGAGALRTMGKAALEGFLQSLASTLGENVGTTDNAETAKRLAVGVPAGTLFGAGAGGAGRAMARAGVDPIAEAAARRAQGARQADAALSYTVPVIPQGRGMPSLLQIDIEGPTMQAHTRGATRSVEGRAVAEPIFAAREQAAVPSVTGGAPNALAKQNELIAARKAQADIDFPAAIEATKGKPILSPTLGELLQTPTGRAAWMEVQKSRPDLVLAEGDPSRALPVIETQVGGVANRPSGFLLGGGMPDEPVVREEVVPDAEAIHLMTRYLRKWASGEKGQIFPEGVNAESAGNAAKLLDIAKGEFPPEFSTAVENYAERSRPIDAIEMGRSRWAMNPTGRKAERLAVENVKADFAKMSPVERAMVRMGKAFDVSTRINEGSLSIPKAAEKLRNPASTLSQELGIAGGPLASRIGAWDDVLQRQKGLLGGAGEVLEPETRRWAAQLTSDAAPTLLWTAIRTARRLVGKGAEVTKKQLAAEDAAFVKLVTGAPGTIDQAIRALAAMDVKVGTTAANASARAGRTGGLLFDR